MRHTRLLASILSIALAALSVGVATAWYSDSAAINYQINAASDFGDEPDQKVWVCKLIGPPNDPQVKEGKNPIHVSIHSVDAEAGFSDDHPSYVVVHGGVECVVPGPLPAAEGREPESVPDGTEEADSATTSTTTTTTTTTTTPTSTTLPAPDPAQGNSTTTSTSMSTSTSSTTTTTTVTNSADG